MHFLKSAILFVIYVFIYIFSNKMIYKKSKYPKYKIEHKFKWLEIDLFNTLLLHAVRIPLRWSYKIQH